MTFKKIKHFYDWDDNQSDGLNASEIERHVDKIALRCAISGIIGAIILCIIFYIINN